MEWLMSAEAREWADLRSGRIEFAPAPLSLKRLARLVEIANDSSDLDVKRAALAVLQRALNPLLMFSEAPADPVAAERDERG